MPGSPGTGRALHCIPHKWRRRKAFLNVEPCRVCNRQLNFFAGYEKCSSCKAKVHTACKLKLGDNCGLTVDVLKEAFSHMFKKDYEEDNWKQQSAAKPDFLSTDSSYPCDSPDNSSSSPGSSTPSTPAYPLSQPGTSKVRTFAFSDDVRYHAKIPEVVPEVPDIVIETEQCESPQRLLSSQGSDSTVRGDGATSSEGTLLTESYGAIRGSSGDIPDEKDDSTRNHILHRNRWSNGTIRIPNNWTDVTISPGQVEIKERSLLGHGRFGDVHKGNYFGDVAVKMLDMSHVDESVRVEAFKVGHFINSYLRVPERWLTYLAPELIRSIASDLRELPFSEHSDMYSFGTIWYELMTYQFPFSKLPSDVIIYRVGKGCTGELVNVKAAREVKEILMHCWAFAPSTRISFVELQTMIERLPKKRLTRSPSYPVSRSHDSMFI
ncbi:unnamed protein product [Enterobius vermicularis]|uniref:Protein kinase domain-containing protein n=1 Tax=Enterobius vermicularis TaxID=51028 RepID=A0A0N4VLU9_ENTVE|nr:unnamed protein product [Enterobius vermicularis]